MPLSPFSPMQKLFVWLIAVIVVIAGLHLAYAWLPREEEFGAEHIRALGGRTSSAAMEGKKPADPRVSAARDILIGKWSSEDDRNFIREYKDDGTLTDSYTSSTGETKTDAQWVLFTSLNNIVTNFPQNTTDVYIMQTETQHGGVTYFRIVMATPTQLELANMTLGGGLKFGKITTDHELQD